MYMSFYVENREKMAACLRTLYRIYDLLDHSSLEESVKKNYLKIIRAQLTDSELFLLRYNGMSYYGANFISYLNKYNVLKHLPAFELLEFKDWWCKLTKVERMGINIVFYNSVRIIRHILSLNYMISFSSMPGEYKYNFLIKSDGYANVEIILKINTSVKNHVMEYVAFDKFNNKEIQALLDCYLKELFLYSNFGRFNRELDLEFYSNPPQIDKNLTVINSGVRNKKMEALVLSKSFER